MRADADGMAPDGISEADQRALFERLRSGDEAAFNGLFRLWYAPLVRIAGYVTRDQMAAEEIVQDVWLEVWRRRESLTLEQEPRRYLTRATRNRALNVVRRQSVAARAALLEDADETEPAIAPSEVDAHDLERALAAAVALLPPRCRAVFELSRRDHMSHAQIADALDIAPKTVENQLGKAMRILRVALAPWLPDNGNGADNSLA
jgi:RNA polymerase sigma-70 factor, ECF subfamily